MFRHGWRAVITHLPIVVKASIANRFLPIIRPLHSYRETALLPHIVASPFSNRSPLFHISSLSVARSGNCRSTLFSTYPPIRSSTSEACTCAKNMTHRRYRFRRKIGSSVFHFARQIITRGMRSANSEEYRTSQRLVQSA